MGYAPCRLSEYAERYESPHSIDRSVSFRPVQKYQPSSEPFANETTHTKDFQYWPVVDSSVNFKPKINYRAPDVKFDHQSVSQTDFVLKTAEPTTNFRSNASHMNLLGIGFQRQNLPSADLPFLRGSQPISDLLTSDQPLHVSLANHTLNFKKGKIIRPKSTRHLLTGDENPEEFTSNTDHFKSRDFAEQSISFSRSALDIKENFGLCGDISTYREAFRGQTNQDLPPRLARPKSEDWKYHGPVVNQNSVYMEDYGPKKGDPCPAGLLLAGQISGYKLIVTDKQGHRWYKLTGLGASCEQNEDFRMKSLPAIDTA